MFTLFGVTVDGWNVFFFFVICILNIFYQWNNTLIVYYNIFYHILIIYGSFLKIVLNKVFIERIDFQKMNKKWKMTKKLKIKIIIPKNNNNNNIKY